MVKVKHNGLMRIFWPSDSVKHDVTGVLVGWQNSPTDLFVASILEEAEVKVIDNALRVGTLTRSSPHKIEAILERCGKSPLQVLGVVNPQADPFSFPEEFLIAYTHPRTQWPHVVLPTDAIVDVQLVLFKRPLPTRMQYMSLEPITLALTNRLEMPDTKVAPTDDIDRSERLERDRISHLVQKMRFHTVVKFPPTKKELVIRIVLNQVNCCFEVNGLLQKNVGLIRTRAKRILSVSERVVESASNLWDYTRIALRYLFKEVIYPFVTKVFIHGLIAHRVFGEVIVTVAGWKPGSYNTALKDIAATAQQVDLRLQQFCYWPIQYMTLRERKDNWESITNNHTEYIRFYNSLWLVANDIIMGIAIGSYIIENADAVSIQVSSLIDTWSITGLQRVITWLTRNPAGLKLNTELAKFLSDLFLWVIDYWASCVEALRPGFPHLIRFIGFASFAGASMPIALCSDLLSLFTLHIHCFYVASARIYCWQLTIIVSLFHLFRGKKRNVLRNRIDSCDYELDQLLLGTILFTLLFFLLPTVLVFYFTFALARAGIIFVKAVLDTLLAALNHFPLFAIMLRVKDSGRLPGGIRFELHDTPKVFRDQQSDSCPVSYLILKSTPLPFRAIFHEYFQFGNRIRKHYFSARVFVCFATGTFVPPLHRKNLYALQYSMLPAQRVGIAELWTRLKGAIKVPDKPSFYMNGSFKKHFPNGHTLSRRASGRTHH